MAQLTMNLKHPATIMVNKNESLVIKCQVKLPLVFLKQSMSFSAYMIQRSYAQIPIARRGRNAESLGCMPQTPEHID